MKRLGLLAAVAVIAISCVSAPSVPKAPAATATVAAQVRKERVEEYKTPVVVKETIAFSDGVVDRVVSYAYGDGLQRLVSLTSTKPSSADPIERVTYEYLDGKPSSKSTFGADGTLQSKAEYAYSAAGELIRETISDGKAVVQTVSEWLWDNGHKSSWRVLSTAGTALAKTEYFYEGDSLAVAKMFDGAGNPSGRVEYVYGGDGDLIALRYYTVAGTQDGRIEYERKDGNLVQESVYRPDGRLERRMAYEYASDGALVKKTTFDASGKAREHIKYEYAYRTDTRIIVYYE